MRRPLQPLDRSGRRLQVGDRVRVVGVPDLSPISEPARTESEQVFRHLLGTYRRIRSFNRYGFAELFFRIRSGPHRGLHWVAIEPALLHRPRAGG